MDGIALVEEIRNRARNLLQQTGVIDVTSIDGSSLIENQSKQRERYTPDFILNCRKDSGEELFLAFEVKPYGQPRFAIQAAALLKTIPEFQGKAVYGVFAGPYINSKTMEICRSYGIGSMDLAGNCFMQFDGIYIEIQGKNNPYPDKRKLKSVFGAKSTRVIRVLLENPGKEWYVKNLVEITGLSSGQVSNVKRRLLDYDLAEEVAGKTRAAFKLKDPAALLAEWTKVYSYKKNQRADYYSFDETETIEELLAEYCRSRDIKYAFTITSGANLVAPFLRYKRVFAYIDGSFDTVTNDLGWSKVGSGANISLIEPYDEGVMSNLQDINDKKVVSNIQLYLDLQSYEQRGAEAADVIKKQLEEKW